MNNNQVLLQAIHNDTVSILSKDMDTFIMELYAYERHINELTKTNYLVYASIINQDPLTCWLIVNFMERSPIRPLIRFDQFYMANNIQLYQPYLSKWIEYIVDEYTNECIMAEGEDGVTMQEFMDSLPLPYYIKNRMHTAPLDGEESFIRYIFNDIFEALARNDYRTFIDMCLEVTQCLQFATVESKEVI